MLKRRLMWWAAAVVMIAVMPCAGAIASGPASGAAYVALGDSYAAGEGLGPFEVGTDTNSGAHRNRCHRSRARAFSDLTPAVVLPWVRSRGFWACSGATVADMESVPPQSGAGEQYRQPQQTATVSPSTRWISVSVGGDDLHFKDIGLACAGAEISHLRLVRIPGQPPCAAVLAAQTAHLRSTQTDLENLYHRLLSAAPNAKLVAVGYPRIFPASYARLPVYQHTPFCILDHYQPGVTLDIGLTVPDAQAVDRFEAALNATVRTAARMSDYPQDAGRVAYADTYTRSVARNCRGTTPHASVAGLVLSLGLHGNPDKWYERIIGSGTFHPTADGQQMMAHTVQAAFARLGARAPLVRGGGGIITPSGKVGTLRIGRSTLADVIRFAGPPDATGTAGTSSPVILAYGYGCRQTGPIAYIDANVFCHVGFYINADTGRLIEFATDSSRYTALGTIRVGTPTARAAALARSPAIGGCADGIHVHTHGRYGYPVLSLLIAGGHLGHPHVTKNGAAVIPVIGGHVDSIVLNGGAGVFDCE